MEIDDVCIFQLEIEQWYDKSAKSDVHNEHNEHNKQVTPISITTRYNKFKNMFEMQNPLKICRSSTPLSSSPLLSSESWPMSPTHKQNYNNTTHTTNTNKRSKPVQAQ